MKGRNIDRIHRHVLSGYLVVRTPFMNSNPGPVIEALCTKETVYLDIPSILCSQRCPSWSGATLKFEQGLFLIHFHGSNLQFHIIVVFVMPSLQLHSNFHID